MCACCSSEAGAGRGQLVAGRGGAAVCWMAALLATNPAHLLAAWTGVPAGCGGAVGRAAALGSPLPDSGWPRPSGECLPESNLLPSTTADGCRHEELRRAGAAARLDMDAAWYDGGQRFGARFVTALRLLASASAQQSGAERRQEAGGKYSGEHGSVPPGNGRSSGEGWKSVLRGSTVIQIRLNRETPGDRLIAASRSAPLGDLALSLAGGHAALGGADLARVHLGRKAQ